MRASRTVPAALTAAFVAAALSACTPDGPTEPAPPLGEALAAYTDLRDDAMTALEQADGPDLTWAESVAPYPSIAEQDDGGCVLFVTNADGTGTIDDAEAVLTSLAASLDPVLEEHGMGPMSGVQHTEHGGQIWTEAVAATGWSVALRGGGQSSAEQPDALVELSINGPVATDTCDDAALQEALAEVG